MPDLPSRGDKKAPRVDDLSDVAQESAEEIVKLTVRVPERLRKELRIAKAETGRSMQEIIREAARQWLNQ